MSQQPSTLNGADEMVRCLVDLGVDTVFCITGAGNLALVDALTRDGRVRLLYCHHEQAVVMAAQGYARVSGRVGVALVTTGGGAANALTGALSAHLDSVPVLLLTGNESSFHCSAMADFRAYGVQGFDAVSAFGPVTKFSARIMATEEIVPLLAEAWERATTSRKGVALLDFPMDLQRQPVSVIQDFGLARQAVESRQRSSEPADITELVKALAEAGRPLLYLGNGVRDSGATELALDMINRYQLPFVLSWSAADLIEDGHALNVGKVGIYGDRAANIILQQCDLLLCVGTRLAIPQIGYDQADFARNAQRWVVDVDQTELSKFVGPRWHTVCADALDFLQRLDAELTEQPADIRDEWVETCDRVWTALPREEQTGQLAEQNHGVVHSCSVMECLNDFLPADAVIVTDVGAGLLSGHYSLRPRGGQRLFTSQGLGEMGFGLPAAIGAHFADTGRPIVCLSTDGGLMFNLQELQTARCHGIPLKLLVFNNNGYGMIRISQSNLFDSRFAGIGPESGVSFPDFSQVAETFGFNHCLIDSDSALTSVLPNALSSSRPEFIEVRMSPDQKYEPRLATTRLPDGTLASPPLEDLCPYISLDELEALLGTRAHRNSYLTRGLQDG
ncbi:thiamine pyrophosphate-binding protein [bacterium]|nr:thiamine pyrophosphate-binding protein [bacterium]